MRLLIALMLMAGCAWGVTQEEIDAQAAVVAAAQAELDSLTSQSYAGLISSALDSSDVVLVEAASKSTVTGLRDPMYVDVVVPYDDWDSVTKRMWAIEVRELSFVVITVDPARYSVHSSNATSFIEAVRAFVAEIEE